MMDPRKGPKSLLDTGFVDKIIMLKIYDFLFRCSGSMIFNKATLSIKCTNFSNLCNLEFCNMLEMLYDKDRTNYGG